MKSFVRSKKHFSCIVVVIAVAILFFSGSAVAELPGEGVKVVPTYAGVAETLFQLKIVSEGLKRLGYEIMPTLELSMVTMHVAVAQGDADFLTNHWDPLHQQIYEKAGGGSTIERVGVLADGALQGYLIDKKTSEQYDIKDISQLKKPEIAKLFDANKDGKADLTGCNPVWGCERVIEHHLDAYDLRDTVKHVQGSYFALIADTITRFKSGESILYYTWTPQWVSGVLVPGKDVVWLTVPFTSLPGGKTDAKTTLPDGRNIGFEVVKIRTLANKKFLEANPAAKRFFELAKIPIEDISAQNLKMKDGEKSPEDIDRHVSEWIAAHQQEFDSWVEQALQAAK